MYGSSVPLICRSGIENFPRGPEGHKLVCQLDREKPFKLSPSGTTSGDDGKLAFPASTQHVSTVAKVGFKVEYHSIHIYLGDRSTVNWSSLVTGSWKTKKLL